MVREIKDKCTKLLNETSSSWTSSNNGTKFVPHSYQFLVLTYSSVQFNFLVQIISSLLVLFLSYNTACIKYKYKMEGEKGAFFHSCTYCTAIYLVIYLVHRK